MPARTATKARSHSFSGRSSSFRARTNEVDIAVSDLNVESIEGVSPEAGAIFAHADKGAFSAGSGQQSFHQILPTSSARTLTVSQYRDALGDDLADALDFASASKSPATLRAYKADIRDFEGYACAHGATAFPASAELICGYISHLAKAGLKTRTIERRLAALRFAHEVSNTVSPTTTKIVREVMAGIRRRIGRKPAKKAPVLIRHLEQMMSHIPETFSGSRDRALLLLGFAGAFRRSELVALTMDDVIFNQKGMLVEITRSKTDQAGEGQRIAIPNGTGLCPVEALRAWIDFADISHGPIFRAIDRHENLSPLGLSDRTVARIVKKYAALAGLNPANFSGHSLRAGVITEAGHRSKNLWKIRELSRHASLEMLREYVRDGELFEDAATSGLL